MPKEHQMLLPLLLLGLLGLQSRKAVLALPLTTRLTRSHGMRSLKVSDL